MTATAGQSSAIGIPDRQTRVTPSRKREARHAWLILAPILLYYTILFLVPTLANLAISLTRWNGIQGAPEWIGLSNYRQYLKAPYPRIISNTLLFATG